MSGKKDKKSKSSKKDAPAASPSSTTPASLAVPITALQRTIEEEIVNKWTTRPFARFPIHKDIPRFVRTITVYDVGRNIIYQPEESETQPQAIHRLIKSLAQVFEPEHAEKLVEPLLSLPERVGLDSMSAALQAMDDLENVTSPTLKILKGLNQSILAPALVNLQLSFANTKFMFIDVKWIIEVHIFDEYVRIDHRRFENFTNINGHMGWTCSLLIRRLDMLILSAKTRIFDFRIPNEKDAADWALLVKPIFEPDLKDSCSLIFNKPWERLPIAKDLVRFATNTTFIIGSDPSSILETGGDSVAHLKQLLLKLSTLSEDDNMRKLIDETFEENIEKLKSGDLNAVLRGYLSDILKWTDDCTVARFCKFFTQSIIAPLATNLQLGLSGISPIKDGTSWNVRISLVPTGYVIRHTKEQVSLERTIPNKTFNFSWQVEFEVDKMVTNIISVNARLVSLDFTLHQQLSATELEKAEKELTNLINITLL